MALESIAEIEEWSGYPLDPSEQQRLRTMKDGDEVSIYFGFRRAQLEMLAADNGDVIEIAPTDA